MDLAERVYQHSGSLPDHERFGLISQIRRATTSVPFNIAEGYGLGSRDQFLRHLRIARGSLCELDTAMELSTRLYAKLVSPELLELLAETDRVLQGLIRSLEEKND